MELRCSFLDASSDQGGANRSLAWSFGDGATSSSASPVHTYDAPGTYTASLTVTDQGGGPRSISRAVVMNLPPHASFDFACSGLTCTMIDGSRDVAGSIASRSWTFGDGAGSAATNPVHTYAASGTYAVALEVLDDAGASGTTTRTVSVLAVASGAPPMADFAVSCRSGDCAFTDRSGDADGTVTAWSWSFGDGATSAETNPQHTYDVAALREVTVTLTVTDSEGTTAVASKSFNVVPPTTLQCRDAVDTGALASCTITLDRAAAIEIEIVARECIAIGNTFTVTSPVVSTLFTDGCVDPPLGTVFRIDDGGSPFPAGTVFAAQMVSGAQNELISPTLIVTGAASPWLVQFDDGNVAPRDLDIRLSVRLVP